MTSSANVTPSAPTSTARIATRTPPGLAAGAEQIDLDRDPLVGPHQPVGADLLAQVDSDGSVPSARTAPILPNASSKAWWASTNGCTGEAFGLVPPGAGEPSVDRTASR